MNPRDLLSLPGEDALAEGFARTLVELAGGADRAVLATLKSAARAASRATADGHTCLALSELAGAANADLTTLRAQLLASGMVTTAGVANDTTAALPLVLDADDRLYLNRYFATEYRVAHALKSFGVQLPTADEQALITQRLDQRFGTGTPARQRLAVETALANRLTIISGGPGTGKTTTVVQILAILLEIDPACRIILAAPTGKAAARLRDAVQTGAAALATGLPEGLRATLPNESFTVHRLLAKARSDGGALACDVLIVDEASMLDLMLADRLLTTLAADGKAATRLILLGDRHQLAAVEAGAVFAEISAVEPGAALHDKCVELTHSWRFGADTALGRVAAAARAGDVEAALAALDDAEARLDADTGDELEGETLDELTDGYAPLLAALRADAAPAALFAALAAFRVLGAVRNGARGVSGLNETITRRFRARLGAAPEGAWFPGRPVLVTRNDSLLRLYNGDVGIALPGAAGGWVVCFEDPAAPGGFRKINPARLPPHETAFAMTVHKAQGSEFERVALVLPARSSPICTRELVYTGITRAKRAVTIHSPPEVLRTALATPTTRHSGLRQRLDDEATDSRQADRQTITIAQALAPGSGLQ